VVAVRLSSRLTIRGVPRPRPRSPRRRLVDLDVEDAAERWTIAVSSSSS
jgi:hypothetical protein